MEPERVATVESAIVRSGVSVTKTNLEPQCPKTEIVGSDTEMEVLSPVFKEYSSLSKVILKLEIFDVATGIVRVVSVLSALTGVVLTLSVESHGSIHDRFRHS